MAFAFYLEGAFYPEGKYNEAVPAIMGLIACSSIVSCSGLDWGGSKKNRGDTEKSVASV